MNKLLLIFFLFLSGIGAAVAQISPSMQPQQIRVEELSDDQVRQIVEDMKNKKVTLGQLNSFAQQKGIPSSEVAKLKERIRSLNLEKDLEYKRPPESHETGRGIDMEDMTYESAGHIQPVSPTRKKIFGAELFSNKNLTFEPNLRMPTPQNYRLAAGDEIIIDVYGYSEVQHKLTVSPEGYIRIPYLGPVYVNGLTIAEAKSRISKQLGTIYSGIKSGNTSVQVSLGTIRSIQVLLIGEVERPGTYTVPSLASVANALYISGGPSENGSFRDIQVIRNGSIITTFDLYDFLTKGDLTNNIILQDQDIVKVNAYKVRIELSGEIKRPGIYEVKEGESLQNILEVAGGFTDLSYRDFIRVSRINAKEREMVNVPQGTTGTFIPRTGDKYFIDGIIDRFSNRVSITGAVFHPGDFALEPDMTLLDLIKKADGLMEVASLSRGIIRRMKADYTPSILNFNVDEIMKGQQKITLQREDSVVIFSKVQLQQKYKVKISGLVNKGGYFDFADSMKLEDLILLAGGMQEGASPRRVEISRRIRTGQPYNPADSLNVIVQQFDVKSDLRSTPDAAEFLLQPYDEVYVRKSPTYMEQTNVSIDGEVVYPGSYTIYSKKERISDLMKRSGGLKTEAYPAGAVLLRKTFINESDSLLLALKLKTFANSLKDSAAVQRLESTVQRKEQLLGINLEQIIKHPGSKFDLFLEEGDIISIPKKLQSVQLFGEVYFPKKVRYDKSTHFRDYIRGAGGYTSNALKRRAYVVYANGDVKSTHKVLFFNRHPKIRPGAEIYVPAKKEGRGLNTQEAIGITTGIASLALILFTIIDKTK